MRLVLKRLYQLLFIFLFAVVTVRAAIGMAEQSKYAAAMLIPFFAFVLLFLPGRFSPAEFSYRKCWIAVQCVSTLLMLALIYAMRLKLSWDWKFLIRGAYRYALGIDVGQYPQYFAVYSNNRFWLTCLIWFFKLIHKIAPFLTEEQDYKAVSMLLGVLMTQAALWLIYRTARELFSEKKAFLTGLLAALFLPFYLYARHAYTDVPGMLCTSLIFFLYTRLKHGGKRRVPTLVLMGITAGLAFRIKVIVAILVIAILIEELLTTRKGKQLLVAVLITVGTMLLVVSGADYVTKRTVVLSDEMLERYEFPLTHWIMMGLKGRGGFNTKDIGRTLNCTTYEKKVKMNIRLIRKRLKNYGFTGLLKHIVVRKMDYTWCRSCLAGDYYGTKQPYKKTVLWEVLSDEGKYHQAALLYTWPYYMLILTGIWFSAAASLRKIPEREAVLDVGRLTILGVTLFLFIWECNSRYLFCVCPLMLLTAAQGIFGAEKCLRKRLCAQKNT